MSSSHLTLFPPRLNIYIYYHLLTYTIYTLLLSCWHSYCTNSTETFILKLAHANRRPTDLYRFRWEAGLYPEKPTWMHKLPRTPFTGRNYQNIDPKQWKEEMRSERQARKEKNESRGSGNAYSVSTLKKYCTSQTQQPPIISINLSPLGPWRYCTKSLRLTATETVIPATAFSHPRWMVNLRGEDAWSLNSLGRVDWIFTSKAQFWTPAWKYQIILLIIIANLEAKICFVPQS